jgi:hypothetical protein
VSNPGILARLDRIESRQALHELNTTYARAADRGDAALLASVYHPEATVVSGKFEGLAAEFVPLAIGIVRKQIRTWHVFTNEWFDIRGDEAIGESYCFTVATNMRDNGLMDNLSGGRYLDTYARRDGAWKFTRRVFVLDWIVEQPGQTCPADGPRGTWAPEDMIYAHWRSISLPQSIG